MKQLIPKVLIVILLVALIIAGYFIDRNQLYVPILSKLVLSMTNKSGEQISGEKGLTYIYFSKNSPFGIATVGEGENSRDAVRKTFILNSNKNELGILGEKGVVSDKTMFSPSGKYLLFTTEAEQNGYTYFYDLHLFDTQSNKKTLLTSDKKYLLFSGALYGSGPATLYGWIDENTVVYSCHPNPTDPAYSPDISGLAYCILSLDSGEIEVKNSPPENVYDQKVNDFIVNSTKPLGDDVSCNYNFENIMCFRKVPRIANCSVFGCEGYTVVDYWLEKGLQQNLLYRGKNIFWGLYWSYDGHLYAIAPWDGLYKLY
jgi:hypothetical protein